MKNGVRIYGIDCFHDDAGGSKRGKNRIFVIEGEGLRVAHLGDLGHLLSAEQLKALGKIDILLIPIGGTYTITTPEAVELIGAIRPHTAVAMHFRTDACHFPITDETEFLRSTGGQALPTSEITVTAQTLEALPSAIVLKY